MKTWDPWIEKDEDGLMGEFLHCYESVKRSDGWQKGMASFRRLKS